MISTSDWIHGAIVSMFTLLMSTFSLKFAGNLVFPMSFLMPPRSLSVRRSAGRIMTTSKGGGARGLVCGGEGRERPNPSVALAQVLTLAAVSVGAVLAKLQTCATW